MAHEADPNHGDEREQMRNDDDHRHGHPHEHSHDHGEPARPRQHGHGHSHGHGHAHGHGHPAPGDRWSAAFRIGIALNLGFVAVEAIAGLAAGSLALLADAGHNLSDVLGLAMAWAATALARRQPSPRRTYGLRRTSILAALTNASLLLLVVGGIAWEAVRRLGSPEPPAGITVMAVALAGTLVNGATAFLFLGGRKTDLNLRGAFLHMAADALISLGVAASGLVILATGWGWIDPIASLAIAVVIAFGTWELFRESLDLALDAVPEGIDPDAVEAYLAALPGIASVHDLHVWAMSTTETALTAHLVKRDGRLDDGLLARACRDLRERFGIGHATLQLESGDEAYRCELSDPARI